MGSGGDGIKVPQREHVGDVQCRLCIPGVNLGDIGIRVYLAQGYRVCVEPHAAACHSLCCEMVSWTVSPSCMSGTYVATTRRTIHMFETLPTPRSEDW